MLLLYYLFEKLHRYCFDYCFQSTNEDWGRYTPYKQANRNNRFEKYNKSITAVYFFLNPYFYKFRYKLVLWFPKKYKRYEPKAFHNLMNYEVDKYYNFLDKIILKCRIYFYNKKRLKKVTLTNIEL